jgi:hypothetical protein
MAHNPNGRIMTELLFIVEEREDGVFTAKAVGEEIAASSNSRIGIETLIREAVRRYFPAESELPKVIHLHFVHDKTIAVSNNADRSESVRYPLRGKEPYRFDDPFSPVGVEDWEALK